MIVNEYIYNDNIISDFSCMHFSNWSCNRKAFRALLPYAAELRVLLVVSTLIKLLTSVYYPHYHSPCAKCVKFYEL